MEDIFLKTKEYIIENYKRFEVAFQKGEGVYLYDFNGKPYLDFLAGIAVNVLGHSHEVVVNALKEQVKKLIHVSNLYYIKEQADLAELLIKNSCCDKAFFCNSGAEANEAAIKLVRLFDKDRYKIISMENSFHGRTLAALAATGQTKYQKGFEPMPDGFVYAKFNDFNDFVNKVDSRVAAVFIELIQGEGGINVADRGYVERLFNYCKENNILFVVDEIQTGIGRTGKIFAYEHYGIEPDVITLAKGLGGGLPIGALLAKDYVASKFGYGTHGSTFGGNPLISYVSKEVVSFVIKEGLYKKAEELGNYMIERLKSVLKDNKQFEYISGMGLMVGVHFRESSYADYVVRKALDKGILIGKAGDRSVRLEPPLIVQKEHIDAVVDFFWKIK
ncbi:aspartate aminotransferase family protein [Hippea maritima]|uniref:Acetylornithine aminotransferase n=1 Tax=Hippea maritima (strain ATCC 700847 / DSM 10411 / MH2) TaxID=760142 RepID=F2LXN5_HIPMA|nr:aspartate aminotransferase family protein [Hippea maritima]AEA33221.1 Acetylornithine/succinyldiaminopimelate aminotransferase [Hippea maritima DSM 10411]